MSVFWWALLIYACGASVTLGILSMVWEGHRKGTNEMLFWSALWPVLWLVVAGGIIGADILRQADDEPS